MKHFTTSFLILAINLLCCSSAMAQETESARSWSLKECLDYARGHNIQIRSMEITKQSSDADLEQAKAQQYPTLSFGTNHSVSFQNTASYNEYMEKNGGTTYQGSFNLNSGYTLYQGGKIRNNIKQQGLLNEASQYDMEQAVMDVEISVVQAYLQILYDNEALKINNQAAELSNIQAERGEQMYMAGSISKGDLAQLKSQYSSDKYQVVSAENALAVSKLKLKQLLELDIEEDFSVEFPEIDDESVTALIPPLKEIYFTALEELPQMKSSNLGVEASNLGVAVAKAAYYPSISLSAGVSTGMYSGTGVSFIDQLNNKLGENIGLSLSIPIFNNKQVRTNVTKAKLQSETSRLQNESDKKQLLSTIESLYNDAASAQSKYTAAKEQLTAAQTSYEIVSEQFDAGIKNTVELITEKNNYISALSQLLQTKYQAVLSIKLLNRYVNKPIEL
ncbi:MAG: TolC family protein [Bacteroidales bacterium]|nr:TolC family protein [Bacteroidales bacterium]MDD4670613.1 TolC family protein [Bacteroidales bacterium]